ITAPVAPGKFTCGTVLLFAVTSVKLLNTRNARASMFSEPPSTLKVAVCVGSENALTRPAAAARPAVARRVLRCSFMGFLLRPLLAGLGLRGQLLVGGADGGAHVVELDVVGEGEALALADHDRRPEGLLHAVDAVEAEDAVGERARHVR